MVERGEVSVEQMKTLVRDPKFICNECGRAAAKADNLCEPVPLEMKCTTCGMAFTSKAEVDEHAKTHM